MYQGNRPVFGSYKTLDDISSQFNGSTTEFTLLSAGAAATFGTVNQLVISLNGVVQQPGISYIAGSTSNKIVFNPAPPAGTPFWGVLLGDVGSVASIADASVTSAKLGNFSVYGNHLADGVIYNQYKVANGVLIGAHLADATIPTAKIQDSAITLQKLSDGAVTTVKITDANVTFAKLATAAIASLSEVLSGTASKIVTAATIAPLYHVTMLRKAATQAIANNTYTALQFDTEDSDDGSWHDNVTNNTRITANFTGVIELQGSVAFNMASNGAIALVIYKNGVAVRENSTYIQAATTQLGCSIATTLTCASGDYFELYVRQTSGSSSNTLFALTAFIAKRIK